MGFKFLISILLLSVVIEASVACTVNDLQIVQTKTGIFVEGKPVWKAEAINKCNCAQSQIMLTCQGFQSTYLDPFVLSVRGNLCLLYNGHLLAPNDIATFGYAWDTPYPFRLASSVTSNPCWGSS